MFSFRGPHSRAFRRKYYSASTGFPVICEDSVYHVSVISRYLHLGGLIHHRLINRSEITRRLGITNHAFSAHRQSIYHNCALPWQQRREIFTTLVLSKLTYGLESWTFSTQQCRDQIHAGIMSLYRRLLKCAPDAHKSDTEILVETELPSPTDLLRSCRLRYFGTLYNCGKDAHWGLLSQDEEWIALISDDFCWMWTQLHHSTDLPDPRSHFPVWQDLLCFHGGYWKKLIRKALSHACLQRQNEHTAIQVHQRVANVLHAHGWVSDLPSLQHYVQPRDFYGCVHCEVQLATKAGESAHMFKRHGHKAAARGLFDGTSCTCCLREYHSRAKVLAHLRHADYCRQQLVGRQMRCSHTPGTGSLVDSELHAAVDGANPFLSGEGPKLPEGRAIDFLNYDLVVMEDLYLCLLDLPYCDDDDLCRELRRVLQHRPISWTKCLATLQMFLDTFSITDAACLSNSFDRIVATIHFLCQPSSWTFFTSSLLPRHQKSVSLEAWEDWCMTRLSLSEPAWDKVPAIPRMVGHYKVVLHAYAGRRRRGDIEWYLNSLSAQYPDHIILMASVDIVIDADLGDIAKAETRDYWLFHIRNGHVIAFIGGPPCNTWSRARNLDLGSATGPRVVRSSQEPWGLSCLRLAELRQVMLGTLLLGFAFECMAALATISGSGLLEHPKDPDHPDLVSIWRLPILQLLLRLPRMRLISFSQGLLGAPSAKPTSFLLLGLEGMELALHSERLTAHLPTGVSIGKDSHGQYRTAPLKEYPPALCRAVAICLCNDLTSMDCSQCEPPVSFIDKCKELVDEQFDGHIGHDG